MFMRLRNHRFIGTMAAVVAGAALIACSGSSAAPTPVAKAVVTSTPAAAATATGTAAAGPVVVNVAQVASASTLVEGKGLTLYMFKNDTAGKSACNGACTTPWPPLTVSGTPTKGTGVTGELGTITRDDGSKQVTYKGLPLYRFASDTAPGDAKGAAIANWGVALP